MTDYIAAAVLITGIVFVLALRDVVLRIYEAKQTERDDKRYQEAKDFMALVEQKVDKLDKRLSSFEANRRRP